MNSLIVGCIDEVSAGLIESVKQLEARFLIHSSHPLLVPFVTNAHGAELDRGNMDTCPRCKLSVPTKFGRRLGSGCPNFHDGVQENDSSEEVGRECPRSSCALLYHSGLTHLD